MEIDHRFIKISLDELQTPRQGQQVIADSWWPTKDGHVLGYNRLGAKKGGSLSPQCNKNKLVAEKVINSMYRGYELVFVPLAFWEIQS